MIVNKILFSDRVFDTDTLNTKLCFVTKAISTRKQFNTGPLLNFSMVPKFHQMPLV